MAAAVSVSSLVHGGTASVSVTGDSATTARMLKVTNPDGSVTNIPFTTNGSGAATITFVASAAGSHTFAVYSIAALVASTTANSTHF